MEPSPTPPVDESDKLTPEQIKQFEREHKLLFIYLAITNNQYCNLFERGIKQFIKDKRAGKVSGSFLDTDYYKKIKPLGQIIIHKANGWFQTQLYLEKNANIPKVKVTVNDFLQEKKNLAILNQGSEYIDKNHHVSGGEDCDCKKVGIGIIPLIIWGVIVLASAISAAYIVHRMTTTTQDRKDLLDAAEKTCKDLNLSPADCANVVQTTQKEETKNAKAVTDSVESVSSGFKGIALIGLAAVALFVFGKSSK